MAEQASHAKSAFLAQMSHELRTPLNGLLGYAQLLERDTAHEPRQLESIGAMRRCGEHLLTLINELLDLARIESNRAVLEPCDFDLAELLSGGGHRLRQRESHRPAERYSRGPSQAPTDTAESAGECAQIHGGWPCRVAHACR